ncbi:hypothetical protein J2X84_002265 [Pseudomonas corrugata]|jgi:hypothetical protein|nr:hypothetical protein [Pseudomonas corrugata]
MERALLLASTAAFATAELALANQKYYYAGFEEGYKSVACDAAQTLRRSL